MDNSSRQSLSENIARVTAEELFQEVDDEHHVSAFQELAEAQEDAASKSEDEESRSRRASLLGIRDSLDVVRAHTSTALSTALRKSASVLSFKRNKTTQETRWMRAEEGLSQLHEDDAKALGELLEVSQRYDNGKLYFRKIHVGIYQDDVNWQVRFKHSTRDVEEQARTLKDATRKVKGFLEYSEPGELDERFQRLFEIMRTDKRYKGAHILFKEGKGKDYYPWKVRILHPERSWTKISITLTDAIQEMESHLEYKEVTPEEQEGPIWERVFSALENYPKCKVFFKEMMEPGPDSEPEKIWLMKVDHPNRGVQFETKSRIFEEAAGQVYDYLVDNSRETNE